MKILVTGASGFLGGNLTRLLLQEGHQVRALIRESTRGVDGMEVERVRGDVSDLASLQAAFQGVDAVIHCAAVVSIQGSLGGRVERVNVSGPSNVVRACLDQGVERLVHFSSVHALDPRPHDQTIDEERALCQDQPPHPAYARSKARGERAVLAGVAQGLKACILNPSGMLGPHDHQPTPIGRALLQLRGRRIPALVDGGYNWVDVRDVAASALVALEKGRPGERYLLTGHSTTLRELAELAAEAGGSRPPALTSPMWLARWTAPLFEAIGALVGQPPLYTRESVQVLGDNDAFDASKARRELGHEPRPLLETLRDSYAWFEEAGMV